MQAINNNQRHAVNQTEWMQQNKKYLKRYDELNELIERLEKEKADRLNRSQVIKRFVKRISKESVITSFDVDLYIYTENYHRAQADGSYQDIRGASE